MSDRLRMLGVFGAGFALGVVLAWTAPPAPTDDGVAAGAQGPPPGVGANGAMGPPPGGDPSKLLPPGEGPPKAGGPPPEGAPLPAGEDAPNPQGALPPGDDGSPPTVDADGNPIGPPPPDGAGPPDGAMGPPLEPGAPSLGGGPPRGTDWIEVHLGAARALWQAEADRMQAEHPDLAERARLLAASVPEADGRAPPLPDVVVLLVREVEMMDAMKAAGVDVSGVEAELATLVALR